MTGTAFSALVHAWLTTVIAISLFVAALALEKAFNSPNYLQEIQDTFNLDV